MFVANIGYDTPLEWRGLWYSLYGEN